MRPDLAPPEPSVGTRRDPALTRRRARNAPNEQLTIPTSQPQPHLTNLHRDLIGPGEVAGGVDDNHPQNVVARRQSLRIPDAELAGGDRMVDQRADDPPILITIGRSIFELVELEVGTLG